MGARSRIGLLAAALLLVQLGHGAEPAYACSCGESSPQEEFEQSDSVFIGRARRASTYALPDPRPDAVLLPSVLTEFDVERVWKGPVQPRIAVLTHDPTAWPCAFSFEVGERYLVYSGLNAKAPRGLATGRCWRTTGLEEPPSSWLREDLDYLSSGAVSSTAVYEASPPLAATFGIVLAAVGFRVRRRLTPTAAERRRAVH
jgi:hypothetical protein